MSNQPPPPRIAIKGHHHAIRVGSWSVLCTWDGRSKKVGPAQMVIIPHPEGDPEEIAKGITPGVLRAIPLGEIIKSERMTTQTAAATLAKKEARESGASAASQIKRMVTDQPRPGRAGRPPIFYATVAFAYTSALIAKEDSPVAWLTQQIGADRKTVENWLRLAREEHGMLTTATHGVAEGILTPKAERALMDAAKAAQNRP
ncbi:hypothetical protein GCM10022252_20230 [Streptosporangium oxazolinicum]|uniref:Uncharacterized protein n=1 Tax=Streptosporangium oxazolinicum TaxID=909287 RepID=A0ABP8AP19_9ACTN